MDVTNRKPVADSINALDSQRLQSFSFPSHENSTCGQVKGNYSEVSPSRSFSSTSSCSVISEEAYSTNSPSSEYGDDVYKHLGRFTFNETPKAARRELGMSPMVCDSELHRDLPITPTKYSGINRNVKSPNLLLAQPPTPRRRPSRHRSTHAISYSNADDFFKKNSEVLPSTQSKQPTNYSFRLTEEIDPSQYSHHSSPQRVIADTEEQIRRNSTGWFRFDDLVDFAQKNHISIEGKNFVTRPDTPKINLDI
ncbi:hypothetical protein KAFR_0E03000 [Kazachstania africana CBS 2517]|uniref:Uncharacterized protein n=1 Tax=Kazachstania africana (strain ATCC 22294 / BCRC 22015 / CBS 2517 / CECT 1963 / NBRC 1671 / NRRL Y-8276) TaxID=1071382 RepID=H2AVQ2_KAZAF|nr:hypothetical protein KAFR_0E03000 [Kazachstania africana CBS 2517]CCF58452.1 hypothetical protein KAFR_0E03000 [Kazachstania africana CBS 2517]